MNLLEQLRDIRTQPRGPSYKALHELCSEAADEIERLRAENKHLQGIIENMREIRTTRGLEQKASPLMGK